MICFFRKPTLCISPVQAPVLYPTDNLPEGMDLMGFFPSLLGFFPSLMGFFPPLLGSSLGSRQQSLLLLCTHPAGLLLPSTSSSSSSRGRSRVALALPKPGPRSRGSKAQALQQDFSWWDTNHWVMLRADEPEGVKPFPGAQVRSSSPECARGLPSLSPSQPLQPQTLGSPSPSDADLGR